MKNSAEVCSQGFCGQFAPATPEEDCGGRFLWDTDDDRRFYEDLVNLRDMVPGVLLGLEKKEEKKDEKKEEEVEEEEKKGAKAEQALRELQALLQRVIYADSKEKVPRPGLHGQKIQQVACGEFPCTCFGVEQC